jgi:hypothetical protein
MHFEFYRVLFGHTSDQVVQSRKQKLEDGRAVRLFVAEDRIDSRRVSLERTTRYRRRQKVLCVSRQQPYAARRCYQGHSHREVVRLVVWRDTDSGALQVIIDDYTQYRSRARHGHECLAHQISRNASAGTPRSRRRKAASIFPFARPSASLRTLGKTSAVSVFDVGVIHALFWGSAETQRRLFSMSYKWPAVVQLGECDMLFKRGWITDRGRGWQLWCESWAGLLRR